MLIDFQKQYKELTKKYHSISKDMASPFVSLSNGVTHTVAVKKNGKVYSWGVGMCGQLAQTVEDINII